LLKDLFDPNSIAVVGASAHHQKIGFLVLKNILDGGHRAKIYPINPDADSILGLKCYPSVLNIKDRIDLAVIIVPAKVVPLVMNECGQKRIKTAIIISSGFSELGDKGKELQQEVFEIAQNYGITVLGPNCLGLIDPVNKLNISFGGALPKMKNTAFISQSGATGTAILDWAKENGMGFSHFISLGNKIDLNENDLLRYLAKDDKTKVILCYLESITDGKEFIEIAKQITPKKPLIILKSGRTAAGQKAASSHTGALAGDEMVTETAFAEAGIIRAESLEDFFELALIFSELQKATSEALIITNAGGPAVIATDSIADSKNLSFYKYEQKEISEITKYLPGINPLNPLDLLGDATSERFDIILSKFAGKNIFKIVLITPQIDTDVENIAKTIVKYKDNKTLVVLIGGKKFASAKKILAEAEIPYFSYPERAIKALDGFVGPKPKISEGHFVKGFKKVAEKILDKTRVLTDAEVAKILAAYHIPMADSFLTTNANQAIEAAKNIGFPVVLKVTSPDILHKTEAGAVKLNINDADELRISYQEVLKNAKRHFPKANILGVTVYKMNKTKVEIALGAKRDPNFGPVIMFGFGGIYIEIIKDFALGIGPISIEDAQEMIESVKLYPLLTGFRGGEVYDVKAIAKAISGLSMLMKDFEIIKEIDINPLIVEEKNAGILALDAKIIFEKN
jgi:acetyltransferase